ncbi:transmembrane protease serine 9-like [Brienomyrus brachyistius]|uniref:transmembrane protease serine 9-like n=1 Tax=Brienomyrus brachyistius TaxID=42636 RepID=UPI0020B3EEA7|nr:transmembrane protease serine 9-like [Brienomyrus brachyistius]
MALGTRVCFVVVFSLLTKVLGQAPLNTRTVGGQNTSVASWPWQATLYWNGFHMCGGSLINRQWVLTAAHCFPSTNPTGWSVYLGQQNQGNVNPARIVLHPLYDSQTHDNDIALLKLNAAVYFTNYIQPICLADNSSTFYNGTETWVTGWGDVSSNVSPRSTATLQEVQTPVVGNGICSCLYEMVNITITDNMICAGLLQGGKGSCQGDSGGPLVVQQGSVWVQAGVASFGCVETNYPEVFTRVSHYENWINFTIATDQPCFVAFLSNGTESNNGTCVTPTPTSSTPSYSFSSAFTFNTTENSSMPTTTDQSSFTSENSSTSTTITQPSAGVCGFAPLNNALNSEFVEAGMWPWQVSLRKNGVQVCGGTLITQIYVLSAAECFNSSVPNSSQWTVVLGMNVSLGVSDITLSNLPGPNIALLHLAKSVTLADYIQPVCLDLDNTVFTSGAQCWVTRLNSDEGGVHQQETSVEDCASVSSDDICTPALSSLTGYTGGALVSQNSSTWFQGAVIMKNSSSSQTTPQQIFTSLSRFKNFLKGNVGPMPQPGRAGQHFSALLSLTLPLLSLSLMSCALKPTQGINWLMIASAHTYTGRALQEAMALGTSVCLVVVLSLVAKESYAQSSVCGQAPLNASIVGGQNTSVGSWPWQARLYWTHFYRCEGSLINRQWVLTAAQCFPSAVTNGWVVYLGQQTSKQSNLSEAGWNLSRIIQHPNYTVGQLGYNIALVKLQSAVNFTDYIRPVCLAASGSTFYSGTETWVTGMTLSNPFISISNILSLLFSSGNLQQVKIPVVGNRQCYCLYSNLSITLPSFNTTQNFMCAGQLAWGGTSTCQGHLGSPVIAKYGHIWVQAGVENYVCVKTGLPGVYARVSQYEDWINSTITSDRPGFVTFTSNGTDSDNNVTCTGVPPITRPSSPAPTLMHSSTSTIAPITTAHSSTSSTTAKPDVCGLAPLNNGGSSGSVAAGAWPWQVSLQKNGVQVCGGTLITRRYVMSAAECFNNSEPNSSQWTVVLGMNVSLGVSDIKQSNLPGPNIALLHLAKSVTLTDYVQPVCLDLDNTVFTSGAQCWVTGWSNIQGGVQSLQQQEAIVENCATTSPDQICTVVLSSLTGYTGGALVSKRRGSWFQGAVIMTGNSSTRAASRQVFTKTSKFKSFIGDVVGLLPQPSRAGQHFSALLSLTLPLLSLSLMSVWGH